MGKSDERREGRREGRECGKTGVIWDYFGIGLHLRREIQCGKYLLAGEKERRE